MALTQEMVCRRSRDGGERHCDTSSGRASTADVTSNITDVSVFRHLSLHGAVLISFGSIFVSRRLTIVWRIDAITVNIVRGIGSLFGLSSGPIYVKYKMGQQC